MNTDKVNVTHEQKLRTQPCKGDGVIWFDSSSKKPTYPVALLAGTVKPQNP